MDDRRWTMEGPAESAWWGDSVRRHLEMETACGVWLGRSLASRKGALSRGLGRRYVRRRVIQLASKSTMVVMAMIQGSRSPSGAPVGDRSAQRR